MEVPKSIDRGGTETKVEREGEVKRGDRHEKGRRGRDTKRDRGRDRRSKALEGRKRRPSKRPSKKETLRKKHEEKPSKKPSKRNQTNKEMLDHIPRRLPSGRLSGGLLRR
jgi:hypothetical protein